MWTWIFFDKMMIHHCCGIRLWTTIGSPPPLSCCCCQGRAVTQATDMTWHNGGKWTGDRRSHWGIICQAIACEDVGSHVRWWCCRCCEQDSVLNRPLLLRCLFLSPSTALLLPPGRGRSNDCWWMPVFCPSCQSHQVGGVSACSWVSGWVWGCVEYQFLCRSCRNWSMMELKKALAPPIWCWSAKWPRNLGRTTWVSKGDMVFLRMCFFGFGWIGSVMVASVLCLCQPSSSINLLDRVRKYSFWSERAAFDPIRCSHGSKKKHELICERAKMSAAKHAMIKQLDISLAWWRVKELHTNSCVEDVKILK